MSTVGNPDLAAMAALYRQLGTAGNTPAGAQIAQGVNPPMPEFNPGDLTEATGRQTLLSSGQGMQEQRGLYDRLGDEYARQRAIDARATLQSQQAVPHFKSWMRPVTGQGIGHDILNGIRDAGVGLLAGLASTPRGQDVVGMLKAPERAALAETLRQRQNLSQEEATTAAALGHPSAELARPFGAMAAAGRTQMDWGKFERQNAEQIREFDARQEQQIKIENAKLANIKDVTQMKDAAEIAARHIMANAAIQAAGLHLQGAEAQTFMLGQIAKVRATASDPIWSALTQAVGRTMGLGGEPQYEQIPSGGQGSAGRAGGAPIRAIGPNGHQIEVRGGRWVDAATGQPIQ